MDAFHRSLNFGRGASRIITFAIAFTALMSIARAQTPQPPYALFQYSTLTGSGNKITATQIPVVTATGITVYVNATLQFDVDSNGNLTFSPGFPQLSAAPTLLASSFKAGRYVGPNSLPKVIITVGGPGVSDGGATQWSLSSVGAFDAGLPSSATWYVGPITSSPLAARLSKAGITSTAWSYGVGAGGGNNWRSGGLVGASQIGNTLVIVSFSDLGGDRSTPVDQITFTLAPAP